jgi:alpha-2-macroglobulin-like protein
MILAALNHHGDNKMKAWYLILATLGGILCLTMLQSFPSPGTPTPDAASPAVTYSHGVLRASIPYRAPHAGTGRLTLEVLDPDDRVLGRTEQSLPVQAGPGHWLADLRLSQPIATDELVWQRLRYSFAYAGHPSTPAIAGADSISQVLRMPVVHILGQQSYLTGAQAAVRVIVTDSRNQPVSGLSSLRIELAPAGRPPQALFTGRLNARGTAEAQFRFPTGLTGTFPLRYVAETPIGQADFTQQVRLQDRVSILLTTEKPIYQPGQTIHVRALSLDRANHAAAAARPLTFELTDPRGNKVFRKATQTDRFGVASAEFALADEVNLGAYHLRAVMGEQEPAELTLNVDRYVLPKFKVAIDLDPLGKSTRTFYRPGDHVTGTVRANYFFGKSVDSAEIEVKASGIDVAEFQAVSVHGRTKADGDYRFDLRLPDYFAGRPLTQGAAALLLEATVKDAAGHAETHGQPITVSDSPLTITAVPEGGTLVPHLENQVFIVTAYPDGTPAVATVKVHAEGNPDQTVATDESGVAIVKLRTGDGPQSLQVDAADKQGNHAAHTLSLQARAGLDQVLLRTEHAVYRAGDRIALHVFSTKNGGTAYVDVVKEGQTVLTRDLDLVNGQADLTLTATPDLAGTLDFHAYLFGQNAQPVGDHRLVFVQPAGELKIDAAPDSPSYKPGDEARIRFHVTNERGEGVAAALGLQVVDEAVFALAEKQPGMAKVFFYLEQEAMKPRYEIHSFGMPDIVAPPVPMARAEQHDRAARALFAATEMIGGDKFETEFGRAVPMAKYAEYSARFQQRYRLQLSRLAAAFSACEASLPDCAAAPGPALQGANLDPWGTALRVQNLDWAPRKTYEVRSAGPDKKFETADDLVGYLEVRGRLADGRNTSGPGRIGINVEHDRGPFNGFAEHVRSWFPESLYINPEIITDKNGARHHRHPHGRFHHHLAHGHARLHHPRRARQRHLQPQSLPGFLRRPRPARHPHAGRPRFHPVAVYNYSGSRRRRLQLQAGRLVLARQTTSPTKPSPSNPAAWAASQFTWKQAHRQVQAHAGRRMTGASSRADIVVREIEVVPNGREQSVVFNGRLETSVRARGQFPAAAIPDASKVFVRLYPGPLSQVIEGMDSILRMPGGCFEQTSSSTYPNVLALDYMKRTKKLTPEVHAKAEGYIANGYQRLLTFEVPGGGFSWFGRRAGQQDPDRLRPDGVLRHVEGLRRGSERHRAHPAMARRAAAARRKLEARHAFINEGATNRYNSDVLRITAYIAWSLENTGYQGPAVEKAPVIEQHI